MMDDVRPAPATVEGLTAALLAAFERRDAAEMGRAVEALRRWAPNHPDVHLGSAFLLEQQGRDVEAMASRIRGYERLLALQGDDRFRALLHEKLDEALGHVDGLAMVRPTALVSSHADVLRVFVTLACNAGQIEEARQGMAKLKASSAGSIRDLEDAVAFAERINDLVWFAPDGTVVAKPGSGKGLRLHHGTVVQILIGAATRQRAVAAAFGSSLPGVLRAWGLWSEASARECALLLLTLGRDDAASSLLDGARATLTRPVSVEVLGHAALSCVRRGEKDALAGYMKRLVEVSGCRLAGLTRLASLVGTEAERSPLWAEPLSALYDAAAARAASAAAIARETTPPDRAHDFLVTSDAPRRDRIDVFLKCVARPFDIRPFLEFWLECFSDTSRYRIRLLDDTGLDLRKAYPQYPIEDSFGLRSGSNPWVKVIEEGRRPINLLGWESVANLTPFTMSQSDWFWNIDADDIRPLLGGQVTVEAIGTRLKAVERHARRAGLMAISYDIWASLHWLAGQGYHWTFGICFCRRDPGLLRAMLASLDAVDITQGSINIDHLLSRFSDGTLKGGLLQDQFASFVFDQVQVLNLDRQGRELFHSSSWAKKKLDFYREPGPLSQCFLHEKTLVV